MFESHLRQLIFPLKREDGLSQVHVLLSQVCYLLDSLLVFMYIHSILSIIILYYIIHMVCVYFAIFVYILIHTIIL